MFIIIYFSIFHCVSRYTIHKYRPTILGPTVSIHTTVDIHRHGLVLLLISSAKKKKKKSKQRNNTKANNPPQSFISKQFDLRHRTAQQRCEPFRVSPAATGLVDFNSVLFKTVSGRPGKPIRVPSCLSDVSPRCLGSDESECEGVVQVRKQTFTYQSDTLSAVSQSRSSRRCNDTFTTFVPQSSAMIEQRGRNLSFFLCCAAIGKSRRVRLVTYLFQPWLTVYSPSQTPRKN